ncbi:ImmA/IrrE family metallo-endopeptidase [Mesorhizobium sp. VNQ89]|uniref:ImmA/IrrE family metallo-endopeptidase n=1 Tax=Mesorhizobium quangtriensis TaxID=3157709 RepID=UPI0032B77875
MLNLSEETIEARAGLLRNKLGLEGISAPCMHGVLEAFEQKAKSFTFRVANSGELGQDEALMDEAAHTLIIRESVLDDIKAGRVRARFTVAHELGHYLLGHKGMKQRTKRLTAYPTARDRIEEEEANVFASYFLVPTRLAWDAISPEDIAMRFQVSSQVAEIAFERICRAKRKFSGQLRRPPDTVVDFLKEAKKRGHPVRSNLSDFDD